jgi:hypothetical protein
MTSAAPIVLPDSYVPYSDSIEVRHLDEENTINELTAAMRGISETLNDRSRHAARTVHAKSHGLLKGAFEVYENLPAVLSQGLFAKSHAYPVVMRFSTNPGDILPDSISTPRGLAIKIVGIEGQAMVPEHAGSTTQDFVCVNAPVFSAPDSAGFLEQVKTLAEHVTDSQAFKQIVSTTARVTESALEAAGHKSGFLLGFGHPETHPLGETFYTQTPIRYGEYIAKLCIAPLSPNLFQLAGQHVDIGDRFSALRDTIVRFFETETAVWEIRVQLCTNLTTMPIEDASIEWPQSESPYFPVASITVHPQNAYSAERRLYFDERLSFNPWHALAARRPLGNIMRARRQVYAMSSQYRHRANGQPMVEPKSASDIPD